MKQFIIIIGLILFANIVYAQCTNTVHLFEMKLVQKNEGVIKVLIRLHSENNRSMEVPNESYRLDGLVFAISWPTTSADIKIIDCRSATKPFDIKMDLQGIKPNHEIVADNIQTFFHDNTVSMPINFNTSWVQNEWIDIATISYSGTLKENDFFSLLTCDYGLIHPNSFQGNSTTDPWFALFDAKGNYLQFTPKMIAEATTKPIMKNTYKVYPNPAKSSLYVEILSYIKTDATIKIMKLDGSIVLNVNTKILEGENKNSIDVSELFSGEYLLQVTDGKSINYTQKISKY